MTNFSIAAIMNHGFHTPTETGKTLKNTFLTLFKSRSFPSFHISYFISFSFLLLKIFLEYLFRIMFLKYKYQKDKTKIAFLI